MSEKTMNSKALISHSLPIPSALGSLDAYISAVNRVPVRAMMFMVSSVILGILGVRALMATLAAAPGVIA